MRSVGAARPILGAALTVLLLLPAAPAPARTPADAPPLPPPDPAVYTIVTVDTAQELADACWNLTSGQAIVIAPGTYDLAAVSFPQRRRRSADGGPIRGAADQRRADPGRHR